MSKSAAKSATLVGDIKVEIINISPAMASTMLKKNVENNRNIRMEKVDALVNSFKNDEFYITGQNAILFNVKGDMVDGQHRLTAIVKYGKPVTMMVVRGLHPDALMYIDTHSKRTIADVLKLHGHKNCSAVASAANIYKAIVDGNVRLCKIPTLDASTVLDILKDVDINDSVDAVGLSDLDHLKRFRSVLAGLHAAVSQKWDRGVADGFLLSLTLDMRRPTSFPLRENDPSLHLQRSLHTIASRPRSRPPRGQVCTLAVQAFNAYVAGKPVSLLRAAGECPPLAVKKGGK